MYKSQQAIKESLYHNYLLVITRTTAKDTLLRFYWHECFPVGATQQITGILLPTAHHEFTYRFFKSVLI
jgi:hypothetical protein